VQSGQMYLADGCKRLRRRDWVERRRSRMPLRVGLYWGEELSRPRGRERQGRGPAMWENLLQAPWENSLLRKCPVRYRPFKLAPTLLSIQSALQLCPQISCASIGGYPYSLQKRSPLSISFLGLDCKSCGIFGLSHVC